MRLNALVVSLRQVAGGQGQVAAGSLGGIFLDVANARTLPSFENALRSTQRRATAGVVLFSLLLGAWAFLLACQITDDIVDPVPTPALLIIGVVALVLAGALTAPLVVASRSPRAREQYRIAAALASEHLPADLDASVWDPALRKRSDRSRRNRSLLLTPLLGAFGAVQLNRTSGTIYGTLLWTTYLAVMLLVVLSSLTTFTRTRSVAQRLLVQLDERTRSPGTH